MKIGGNCTVEIVPTEGLRWRRSLYTMLFEIYFEESLNTSYTKYPGICSVISYKTRHFLLLAEVYIVFSRDKGVRCVMKELLKE